MGVPYLFDKSLESKVPDLIKRFSNGKQVLIFCHSKNSAEKLCSNLPLKNGMARIIAQIGKERIPNHQGGRCQWISINELKYIYLLCDYISGHFILPTRQHNAHPNDQQVKVNVVLQIFNIKYKHTSYFGQHFHHRLMPQQREELIKSLKNEDLQTMVKKGALYLYTLYILSFLLN